MLEAKGKPGKQSKAHSLLRRFRQHTDAILRFIADPAVPFSSNAAEQTGRMPNLKQKISGCLRTVEGITNFCRISSCLVTLHKRGHSILKLLCCTLLGDPIVSMPSG